MIDTNFCENCGAALMPGAKFCEECGEPAKNEEMVAAAPQAPGTPVLPPAVAAPAVKPAQAQPAPRVQANIPPARKLAAPKKKASPWLWIGLGAGLFAASRLLPGGLNLPGISAASPKALPDQVSPIDGMTLINVPAGKFSMGFSKTDVANVLSIYHQAYPTADWPLTPNLRTIYLDGFWVDKTEVTNGMFARCVQQGGCTKPANLLSDSRNKYYGDPGYDNFPVINVTWKQSTDYCRWAGRRLPSDAEWEKAARGTDGRSFPWGKSTGIDCTQANYKSCQGDTGMVGILPAGASPYGALDMEGNVEEWVADWFAPDYWKIAPSSNPQGPASGTARSSRGAGWDTESYLLVVSFTDFHKPEETSNVRGFRCAVTAP